MVAKPDFEGHFTDSVVLGEKQFAGAFEPAPEDELFGRHAGGSFEHARKMKDAQARRRRHVFEGHRFIKVLLDVVGDAPKLERCEPRSFVSQ